MAALGGPSRWLVLEEADIVIYWVFHLDSTVHLLETAATLEALKSMVFGRRLLSVVHGLGDRTDEYDLDCHGLWKIVGADLDQCPTCSCPWSVSTIVVLRVLSD